MKDKLNIQPFYIGQNVVGATNHNQIVKDKKYTVTGTRIACLCGITYNVDNMTAFCKNGTVILKGQTVRCSGCGSIYVSDGLSYYLPSRFAEIKQQSYPLMTFSKIVEKEKEEILINN